MDRARLLEYLDRYEAGCRLHAIATSKKWHDDRRPQQTRLGAHFWGTRIADLVQPTHGFEPVRRVTYWSFLAGNTNNISRCLGRLGKIFRLPGEDPVRSATARFKPVDAEHDGNVVRQGAQVFLPEMRKVLIFQLSHPQVVKSPKLARVARKILRRLHRDVEDAVHALGAAATVGEDPDERAAQLAFIEETNLMATYLLYKTAFLEEEIERMEVGRRVPSDFAAAA